MSPRATLSLDGQRGVGDGDEACAAGSASAPPVRTASTKAVELGLLALVDRQARRRQRRLRRPAHSEAERKLSSRATLPSPSRSKVSLGKRLLAVRRVADGTDRAVVEAERDWRSSHAAAARGVHRRPAAASSHQAIVSMKWPPSPPKRVPSVSASAYQLDGSTRAGVDEVAEHGRAATGGRTAGGASTSKRREAAVEADLQPVVAGLGDVVAMTASSSSSVRASGFSTKTALPARSAVAGHEAAWDWCRVTTKTASMDASSSSARWSVVAALEAELALGASRRRASWRRGHVRPARRRSRLDEVRQQHGRRRSCRHR